MAATTIMGEQKVYSHRSQTVERGEWSRCTEKGRGACMWGGCGMDMHNMKSDRDRERGTEGHRKTQKERKRECTLQRRQLSKPPAPDSLSIRKYWSYLWIPLTSPAES